MADHDRRQFLASVGTGMLITGLGAETASDLGVNVAFGDEPVRPGGFGRLDPLVSLLQETAPDKLMPLLTERIRKDDLPLNDLAAATAFANARAFGGMNYHGYHVFMAIAPAFQMASGLEGRERFMPLLKVIYRNAHHTQATSGQNRTSMTLGSPGGPAAGEFSHGVVRSAVNKGDAPAADRALEQIGRKSMDDALDAALYGVEDNHDVHTAVLPWRAWAMQEIAGKEHGLYMLRQSVRQCAQRAAGTKTKPEDLEKARAIVPRAIERIKPTADGKVRTADDAWVDRFGNALIGASPEQAAESVVAAINDGFTVDQIGEAVSLAANQLVLRQVEDFRGNYGKRCHGDSPGVHCSDAVNAWRNIVRVCRERHRYAGMMLAAMDVAQAYRWTSSRTPAGMNDKPYPDDSSMQNVRTVPVDKLLTELDGAIRENNQLRSMALTSRYLEAGQSEKSLSAVLLKYAISEDGRLHAEKYYHTVLEEYRTIRTSRRSRQFIALARVTASMYGFSAADKREGRAPGYEETRKLLGV